MEAAIFTLIIVAVWALVANTVAKEADRIGQNRWGWFAFAFIALPLAVLVLIVLSFMAGRDQADAAARRR